VAGLLASALVISGVGRYLAAGDHSLELMRAEVFSVLISTRRELITNRGRRAEIISELFKDLKKRGVGYWAVLDGNGKELIAAGAPKIPITLPHNPQLNHHGPTVKIVGDGNTIHAFISIGRSQGNSSAQQS